ncbi:MAG: pseudouridine synthase, partial [Caulobacteraceae bacterium]
MTAVRVDRLLANLGYGSRREIQSLVKAGTVAFDGEVVGDAGRKIPLGVDLPSRLKIAGAPVDPPPPFSIVMHKPAGVVCSHREAGRSLYELLPPRWRSRVPALSTVGRLDAETTGLILITDDGGLLHRIISPRRHVAKRYRVSLARPLSGDESALFASGRLVLEGETTPLRPAVLEPLSATSATLSIGEGRYHQVRRMFAAAGNHVTALHRDRIGGLDLPSDLAPGAFRPLTAFETAAIFAFEACSG